MFQSKNAATLFLFRSGKPWHGLGTIVDQYPDSAEALRFAGLDYTVEKRRIFTHDQASSAAPTIEVPDYYGTVRTDNDCVLGVAGKEYAVLQNTEAFNFFDAIVRGDGLQYETVGVLRKGERVFITAKLPDYIKVVKDDLMTNTCS